MIKNITSNTLNTLNTESINPLTKNSNSDSQISALQNQKENIKKAKQQFRESASENKFCIYFFNQSFDVQDIFFD